MLAFSLETTTTCRSVETLRFDSFDTEFSRLFPFDSSLDLRDLRYFVSSEASQVLTMVTPLSTTSLSLFTPSTLATQGANVSSTTASSTITDHAFLGYVSVSFVDTTTICSSF
jgi:hypothetical protein